ncbi:hypothetical protein [Rhodoblastus sp.]|uniref:hypothetical protein n=1 Tax=Rhodoblastus sp. TaxID=1962975 RepID=UPI003FD88FBB
MSGAVHFDDQALFAADKIHEIRPDIFLPHEFEASKPPRPQSRPKFRLGGWRIAPKIPRAFDLKITQPAHQRLNFVSLSPFTGRGLG